MSHIIINIIINISFSDYQDIWYFSQDQDWINLQLNSSCPFSFTQCIVLVLETHNLVCIFVCKTGFYQFCCEGVYCPDCPLELNISTLGQNVTLNSALNLSCVNTSFTTTFNTDKQPGNFTIKVSGHWTDNFKSNYLFYKLVSYIFQYRKR